MFFGMCLLAFIPPLNVTRAYFFVHVQSRSRHMLYWDHYLCCFILRRISANRLANENLHHVSLQPELFHPISDHVQALFDPTSPITDAIEPCSSIYN